MFGVLGFWGLGFRGLGFWVEGFRIVCCGVLALYRVRGFRAAEPFTNPYRTPEP